MIYDEPPGLVLKLEYKSKEISLLDDVKQHIKEGNKVEIGRDGNFGLKVFGTPWPRPLFLIGERVQTHSPFNHGNYGFDPVLGRVPGENDPLTLDLRRKPAPKLFGLPLSKALFLY